MKEYSWKWLLMVCVVALLPACDDDDDYSSSKVPDTVLAALEAKYPAVRGVEWDKKSGYYVADFRDNGVETEVWFDSNAVWCMTEIDLRTDLNALPGLVKNAFQTSQYTDWVVDDIDRYERPDRTFYLIEVEKAGQQDRNLFYAEDGTLLKDEADTRNDEVLPNISFN